MAKLSNETTAWIDVDHTTSKRLVALHKAYKEASAAATEARLELETAKTVELQAKQMVPQGMTPIYSHKFGRWTLATEKDSGDIICQKQRSPGGTSRRSV